MTEMRCADCDRPMVIQRVYHEDAPRWRAQGFVRAGAFGRCNGCYAKACRHGRRPELRAEHRDKPRTAMPGPLTDAEVARLRAALGIERAA